MSKILVGQFTEVPEGRDQPAGVDAVVVVTQPGAEDIVIRVVLFTVDRPDGTTTVGAGIYPVPDHGTVLRWDHGIAAEPRVIHWAAPHCADDECGSPCGHQPSGS
jgi:hypothetical protein